MNHSYEKSPASVDANNLLEAISSLIASYQFDHYQNYPAATGSRWQTYRVQRISRILQDKDSMVYSEMADGHPVVLVSKHSAWDTDHFGFKVARIDLIHSHETPASNQACARLLKTLLADLRKNNVKFVSVRAHGDMLNTIHHLENQGFRYFETTMWPTAACKKVEFSTDGLRLMQADDVPAVLKIAEKHWYRGSHFYADSNFSPKAVDQMYIKWMETSARNNEPVVLVEHENKIAGFFNYKIDQELSQALGFSYGRMRALQLAESARGLGLGRKLFQGTMGIIKADGADYIDSGYAARNHLSARLHTMSHFYSAYQEILFHQWL